MFCEHCGKQINDSSKFCKFCGEKISLIRDRKDLMNFIYVAIIVSLIAFFVFIRTRKNDVNADEQWESPINNPVNATPYDTTNGILNNK